MSIDELELVRRVGQVDPLPDETIERAEVLLRAAMAVPESQARSIYALTDATPASAKRGRRSWRTMSAVAASAVALAGIGIGFAAAGGSRHPVTTNRRTSTPKAILTAVEVRRIVAQSTTAASSGTAEVTQMSAINGTPQDGYNTAVTFSGQNIDEKITSVPEPVGSSKSFTTDDRFVDGQFFIYTSGPNDVPEWLHDTNSANDAASMQFPDPRTLDAAISPAAQFAAVGTTTMNGETLTHLVAGDPSAISSAALGSLAAEGTLTSFAIWVDANGVVQQIALSSSATNQVCQLMPLADAASQGTSSKSSQVLRAPAQMKELKELKASGACGSHTTTTAVDVGFADLGTPQSVMAPAGSVDFNGKG